MMISSKVVKLSVFGGAIMILFVILFGYLFFEPAITEETITIKVVNKEKWGNEPDKFFIFSENEVFLNSDNYYHNKSNASELYPYFRTGYSYKVTVVGMYMPSIPRFRNIISIQEINGVEFRENVLVR